MTKQTKVRKPHPVLHGIHDIKEVEALNQPFDPTTQQAVQTVAASGDQKPDTVVQVLQAGYVLHDRVLRPAMVIVAQ